jgi:hypothetical protein
MKGPGIHSFFGWKPIGKHVCAGAVSYNFDITGLIDKGEILKMVFAGTNPTNNLRLQIDGDGGDNYSFSTHTHGDLAGAVHSQAANATVGYIGIAQSLYDYVGELTFQWITNLLLIRGEVACHKTLADFYLRSIVGVYNSDAPYTSIGLLDSMGANFTINIQFFKGVYGF